MIKKRLHFHSLYRPIIPLIVFFSIIIIGCTSGDNRKIEEHLEYVSELYLNYTYGYQDNSKELFQYIKDNSSAHEVILGIYLVFINNDQVKSTISHTDFKEIQINEEDALVSLSFRQTIDKINDPVMMELIEEGTNFYVDREMEIIFTHEDDQWLIQDDKELNITFSESYDLLK